MRGLFHVKQAPFFVFVSTRGCAVRCGEHHVISDFLGTISRPLHSPCLVGTKASRRNQVGRISGRADE